FSGAKWGLRTGESEDWAKVLLVASCYQEGTFNSAVHRHRSIGYGLVVGRDLDPQRRRVLRDQRARGEQDEQPHAWACSNSRAAVRVTTHAPCTPNAPMITATSTSGQPRDVPKTPSAAKRTAQFPITSLREHSQTDRMLLSPERYAQRSAKESAFASKATPR